MNVKPIPKHMFIQKVLPTAYDDSLTYLEMIGKLIHKINEIIDQTNSYEERFGELEEEQAKLRQDMIELKAELEGIEDDLKKYIDDKFEPYVEIIENLKQLLLDAEVSLKQYVDAQNAVLRTEFNAEILDLQRQIDDLRFHLPDIYNPRKGKMDSIQDTIIDLYLIGAHAPITASEFDGLQITATAFDNLGITGFNFDYYGKYLLGL